jgi:hypothetical protein
VDLDGEIEPLEEEAVQVYPDRDRGRLATPRECTDGSPVCLLERLHEHSIPTLAIMVATNVERVIIRAPGTG